MKGFRLLLRLSLTLRSADALSMMAIQPRRLLRETTRIKALKCLKPTLNDTMASRESTSSDAVDNNEHEGVPLLSTTTTNGANRTDSRLSYDLHMFSLQFSDSSSSSLPFSKTTADVWRWKDAILGDGRDFFVPKPSTLSKLQSVLNNSCGLQETVVLSNCARLEILTVSDPSLDADIMSRLVSRAILEQVYTFQQRRKHNPFSDLQRSLDIADWIEANPSAMAVPEAAVTELARFWTHYHGPHEVLRHLCHISAGIEFWPRRPDRPVVFQPFASRDAHILLQLKRTLEISQGAVASILLRVALQAGKSVRDPRQVPELKTLQKYGTGDNAKYSVQPPAEVTEHARQAAVSRIISPVVIDAVKSLMAKEQSARVSEFRREAEQLARTSTEMTWIRKQIHAPTIALREGQEWDETQRKGLLETIRVELKARRAAEGHDLIGL